MIKRVLCSIIIEAILAGIAYYLFLPAMNLQSMGFWVFISFILLSFIFILAIALEGANAVKVNKKGQVESVSNIVGGFAIIPVIILVIVVINIACSPFFNAKSYSNRITVDESGEFLKDIPEVNFKSLPLLDRDSSEKLGDRVMGQMSELVSQFTVSDQYTQINYNNDIIRVTPIEYASFFKWYSNRDKGVTGYITVNSVTGEAKLTKLDKGMKYMPSAYFNENLYRKLRFDYPSTVFGTAKFEIDNAGNPFWVVPTYGYTGVQIKTRVTGVVILDPVTGKSKKYSIDKVPTWVDNAYNADLIIEQLDDWGSFRDGYWNSVIGQKNVVNTTEGYNYLAMNDDIYLYTGITSVLSDESNLGFVLSNMRTGKTVFYSVAGAEEYSAMSSAQGQVQQMKYKSTFPLLINLNNKPTYLVSLKDAAGLVKMYGFVDVADYQKVVVSDASKGIQAAAQNYLNSYADEISEDLLMKKEITVKRIVSATKSGNTFYYVTSEENEKFIIPLSLSDNLPFVSVGEKITVGYYESKKSPIEVTKVF